MQSFVFAATVMEAKNLTRIIVGRILISCCSNGGEGISWLSYDVEREQVAD